MRMDLSKHLIKSRVNATAVIYRLSYYRELLEVQSDVLQQMVESQATTAGMSQTVAGIPPLIALRGLNLRLAEKHKGNTI